jgi:negative modulator of initiation of replication
MKHIQVDEELYQYLISTTEYIGESASSILRRLLSLPVVETEKIATDSTAINNLSNNNNNNNDDELQVAPDSVSLLLNTPVENVFHFINKEELATQRGVVGRFLLILSALHRVHLDSFSKVQDIRGRDRLYFATSEKALAQSGSSTKPRQIPDSQFWVMTNSNTTRKKMMLTEVTRTLGYSDSDIEIIRDLL